MGNFTQDYAHQLALLYELGFVPDEPWAHIAVHWGLKHYDPEVRELAIGCAATGNDAVLLYAHAQHERCAWLARFAQLAAQDILAL